MFKVIPIVLMAILSVSATAKPEAKPGLLAPVAYSAPLVAATSSQAFVRNYNGFAAPLVAGAPLAYTAAAAYSPYAAYVSPYAAYASPYAYSAPLKYTAAPIIL